MSHPANPTIRNVELDEGIASFSFEAFDRTPDTLTDLDAWIEEIHYEEGDPDVLGFAHGSARPAWLTADIDSQAVDGGNVNRAAVGVTVDDSALDSDVTYVVISLRISDGKTSTDAHFRYYPAPKEISAFALTPDTWYTSDESADEYDTDWPIAAMPTARAGMGIALHAGGSVYAIGGNTSAGALNVHERFDPDTNTWTTLANLPGTRNGMGAGAYGDTILVACGLTGLLTSTATNACWLYDILTDSYSSAASGIARYSGFYGPPDVYGGNFLFMGGGHSSAPSASDARIYNFDTDSWSNPGGPSSQANGARGAREGLFHIIGGIVSTRTAIHQVWNEGTSSWSSLASLGTATSLCFGEAVTDAKIYVAFGSTVSEIDTNQEYDTTLDSWSLTPQDGPRTKRGRESVIRDGIFYTIGGRSGSTDRLDHVDAYVSPAGANRPY